MKTASTIACELLTLLAKNELDMNCALRDPFTVACSEGSLNAKIVDEHFREAKDVLDWLDPEDAKTFAEQLSDAEADKCLRDAYSMHAARCMFCRADLPFDEAALEDLSEYGPVPGPRESLAMTIYHVLGF